MDKGRASNYWLAFTLLWVLIFAIAVVAVFMTVTARPKAEPALPPPLYVEELHAHMSDIEHRLLQLEILVGETHGLMEVVQHLLEGGEWLYYVEIALEKEGK